ncbi:MAG: VOC family protein [Verrucomicrobiota bacterium]
MSIPVKPVPEDYGSLVPSLNLLDANAALEFYIKAFNAVERFRMPTPDGSGKVLHGEFQIGNRVIMFSDEDPFWNSKSPTSVGGCPLSLNLYVEDCDKIHEQAVAAGAKVLKELMTYPWGERNSMVEDPFGYRWAICTHVEDLSPEEVVERLKNWNP